MITQQDNSVVQQAVRWVEAEIQTRRIAAAVVREQIEEWLGDYYPFIRIPIKMQDDALDAYDEAKLLTDIESDWNLQEPRPEKMLSLMPAGLPRGVW